jgi:hypothetical protein
MIRIKKQDSKQFAEAILFILLIRFISRNKNTSFEGEEIEISNETPTNKGLKLKISEILTMKSTTKKTKTVNFLLLSDSKELLNPSKHSYY